MEKIEMRILYLVLSNMSKWKNWNEEKSDVHKRDGKVIFEPICWPRLRLTTPPIVLTVLGWFSLLGCVLSYLSGDQCVRVVSCDGLLMISLIWRDLILFGVCGRLVVSLLSGFRVVVLPEWVLLSYLISCMLSLRLVFYEQCTGKCLQSVVNTLPSNVTVHLRLMSIPIVSWNSDDPDKVLRNTTVSRVVEVCRWPFTVHLRLTPVQEKTKTRWSSKDEQPTRVVIVNLWVVTSLTDVF